MKDFFSLSSILMILLHNVYFRW